MDPARAGPRAPASPEARSLITLDSSAIVALFDRADAAHARTLAAFDEERGPNLVPAVILSEVAYLIERECGFGPLELLLDDLVEGVLNYESGFGDLPRVVELALRYDDLPLGFADAAVIACAERNGGRVLTLDRRHFDVVGRELALEVLP